MQPKSGLEGDSCLESVTQLRESFILANRWEAEAGVESG